MRRTHIHSPLLVTPQLYHGPKTNKTRFYRCYLCGPNGEVECSYGGLDDGGTKKGERYVDITVKHHGQTTGARFFWESETEDINDALFAALQYRWFDPMPPKTDAAKFYSSDAGAPTEGSRVVSMNEKGKR